MSEFLVKRIATILPTLVFVSMLIFGLQQLLPGDPALALAGEDRDLATRYFEAWVLRLAGVFPSPQACPACGGPFPPEGAILPRTGETLLCFDCGGVVGLRISAATLDFLRRIGREALPAAAERPPGEAVLRQVEDLCAQVRRGFLQRELRSYDVIRKTLARL